MAKCVSQSRESNSVLPRLNELNDRSYLIARELQIFNDYRAALERPLSSLTSLELQVETPTRRERREIRQDCSIPY